MDPAVAVARQLVYAFTDALDAGDPDAREYAEQQLADFVDETDDGTADEVLVALLDLPLDASTLPLLNEVSAKLARRGPGVLVALLGAALGDAPPGLSLGDVVSVAGAVGALLEAVTRSPDVPPRTENALSVLDAMDQGDLILGLIEVLEGPSERLKQTACEMLVEIGEPAVERLQMSLRDRDAKPWVVDALVDIRERRDPGRYGDGAAPDGAAAVDDAGDEAFDDTGYEVPDDAGDEAFDDAGYEVPDHAADAAPDEADGAPDAPADGAIGAAADSSASDDPAGASASLPDADLIDRDYDAFLERFKRETGQR
jgi:hypothetical protein